jgi:pyrroline-5-carboxylate reductase
LADSPSIRFGVIGFGNMGKAIVSGALDAQIIGVHNVVIYDIAAAARESAVAQGLSVLSSDAEVCEHSDIILLAVKPQQLNEALEQCGTALEDKAVMSIVAGVDSQHIRQLTQGNIRLLRLLPNTPALVQEGAFVLSSDNDFTPTEYRWAESLYDSLGLVEHLPEAQLDAVCGLSGGAPAYAAMFIEALADGGVQQGLPRDVSLRLAAQSCLGTAKLLLNTQMHPASLKDMVSSPAGTTIEACAVLEQGAFRGTVISAVNAASERSAEIGGSHT